MTGNRSHSLPKALVNVSALLMILSVLGFAPQSAGAQCTLGSATTWNIAGNGDWNTKTNWNPAIVPSGPSTNTCITNGSSTVTLDNGADIGNLQLAGGNTLTFIPGEFMTINGTQVINDGSIQINGGVGQLVLNNDVTLSGGGTLTLASSTSTGLSLIGPGGSNRTFSNMSTIDGAGVIGNGALMAVNNSGTIVADIAHSPTSTGVLTLNGALPITNTGSLEAINGGQLRIFSNVNNTGGNIIANGSGAAVNVSSTIQGGTFTTGNGVIQTFGSATLDGATHGAITISGGTTYVASRSDFGDLTIVTGTFNNSGDILINGGNGATGTLELSGNTTLNGPGTLTLAFFNATGGGTAEIIGVPGTTLTNAAGSTIQGGGSIGANSDLLLVNAGTINAGSASAQRLLLNANVSSGAAVINTGTLEATNRGVLDISVVVNNQGGTIFAQAGTQGSSFVDMVGARIEGGTLSTQDTPAGFGSMGTVGSATLDGLTKGAITISTGSTYDAALLPDSTTNILGTITNNGTFKVSGGGGGSGVINLSGNVTLNGGGVVTMFDRAGVGDAFIRTDQSNVTLTNVDNTIHGSGIIGNGALAVMNSGTINADTHGAPGVKGTLILNGAGGVTNSGLMEATSGGNLVISTIVNNQNGNITAVGTNSKVDVMGGTIQGGTLNAPALGAITGTMETVGFATLDGKTHGALTISAGSTYVAARLGSNDTTDLSGTIINNGTIAVQTGGSTGVMALVGDATLTGTGQIQLTEMVGGKAVIQAFTPGSTLTNAGNTIQGSGTIGNGGTTFNNQSGTVDANVAGQTMNLNAGGGVTNLGTFQVDANSTLQVTAPLSNIAGAPGTTESLTGGTFIVNDGTMQINSFGSLVGGGELNNNDTTLTFNGATAAMTDKNGNNAVGALANNQALGTLNVQGGNSFTTSAPIFTNSGLLNIGSGSTFSSGTGGTGTYTQTGGNTTVGGKLNAAILNLSGGTITIQGGGTIDPLAFNMTSGVLGGNGILAANLTNNGGTMDPGNGMGGTFSLVGDYSQSAGIFQEDLSGNNCGGVGELAITGKAALGGMLDINLENGCLPTVGNFLMMTFTPGGLTGSFLSGPDYFYDNNQFFFTVDYNKALGEVLLQVNQSSAVQTPEPGSLALFGTGLIALGFRARGLRRRRATD